MLLLIYFIDVSSNDQLDVSSRYVSNSVICARVYSSLLMLYTCDANNPI